MHPVFKARPHVVARTSDDLTHSRALPDAPLSALRATYAGTDNDLPGFEANEYFFGISNANIINRKQRNAKRKSKSHANII